jgi:hypothetical protein
MRSVTEKQHSGAGALHGQRALFATAGIKTGQVILSEGPLLCAQVPPSTRVPSTRDLPRVRDDP